MKRFPIRSRTRRTDGRQGLNRASRIGILLILFHAGTALVSSVGGEALPDFSWRRNFDPVHGAFNRNEPSPVRLSVRLEGRVEKIPIRWRILQGETEMVSGDTLAQAALHAKETILTLRLPSLEPGDYLLEATADPDDVIKEKDEQNNRSTYAFKIPNGAPVRFRCEGPEGSSWEVYRVELSTSLGDPYPDDFGTPADIVRSNQYEVVVNGIEPGDYVGVYFGPTVNREPILTSYGSFTMPDPPHQIDVIWPRTTPYLIGRPKIKGDAPVSVGREAGAPRWNAYDRISLDGTVRNPTDEAVDIQWLLRLIDSNGTSAAERDTTLYLGALTTEGVFLSGRIPMVTGNFLMQAEVRITWPTGFEDLGEEARVASFVLPLGWIEVER